MNSNGLAEVRSALLGLRDGLGSMPLDVEALRRDVERLIARVDAEIASDAVATAAGRYERLQLLEPAFDALVRKWTDVRDAVASEAAEELRASLSVEAGWRDRWGALTDSAWVMRRDLQSRTRLGDSRPSIVRSAPGQPDRRGNLVDPTLVLDLRYAGGLPLAQIGSLVGLSPAGVQMRIADFEDAVLRNFGWQAVERQVPEGWRIDRQERNELSPRSVLLRRAGREANEIIVTLVPVKDDRESTGRPRALARLEHGSPHEATTVWAVVLEATQDVRFVPATPESRQALRREPLVVVAERFGTGILADAIRAAGSGGDSINL